MKFSLISSQIIHTHEFGKTHELLEYCHFNILLVCRKAYVLLVNN
jgi:hypothetical protein